MLFVRIKMGFYYWVGNFLKGRGMARDFRISGRGEGRILGAAPEISGVEWAMLDWWRL